MAVFKSLRKTVAATVGRGPQPPAAAAVQSPVLACLPPFLLGFLALAVQTLLLRQFLWRVEATGIGVGIFLSTWLAWIGIGARAAQTRFGSRLVEALAGRFPAALLLYLPLAVIQYFLLDHLRDLVGVPEYLASPVGHLALGALVANAPVSFGTGLLFPAATRWLAARGGSTARAYALDTAGAVAAGLLVTALLAAGVRLERSHIHDWQRSFPAGSPESSFATPAATYLYGTQRGTFYTMSAGGVVDTLPEPDLSAEVAALLLSQNPDARRILLLGRAPLAVALALNEFQPQVQVTWCHDDPAYARKIVGHLCGGGSNDWRALVSANRLSFAVPAAGPQAFLRGLSKQTASFDLALIWPASPASPGGAAMLEPAFLKQVRAILKPDGVAALPLGGGPGAWSPEQRHLATAIRANADAVWPGRGVLVPGAGCWWLAGNSRGAPAGAELAAARFGQLGVKRFPDAAIAELYDPMRAGQLLLLCARRAAPGNAAPPATVIRQGLALAWHAEWPAVDMARGVSWMEAHGGMAIVLLVLGAVWLAPAAGGARDRVPVRLTVAWLAAGGFLELSGLLALMQLLEVQFGNLYLLAGLASSFYLAGMFAGNRWAEKWMPDSISPAWVAAVHGMVLLVLLPLAKSLESPVFIVLACLAAGVPAGWYVPLAVARLRRAGMPEGMRGAAVFGGDAFGSALGGLTTSLLLLPWLGPWSTCLSVAIFASGVGCCVLANARVSRVVARIAVLLCIVAGGVLASWPLVAAAPAGSSALPPLSAEPKKTAVPPALTSSAGALTNEPAADEDLPPGGTTREVDMGRMRAQQAKGALSTHKADFWAPVTGE